jgi:hypothetical protein
LFWPASAFSQDGQAFVFMNGNQLYDYCTSAPGSLQEMVCLGYVMGVADTLQRFDTIRWANRICLPQNISRQQAFDVTRNYLRDHPEVRHYIVA